MYGSPVQFDVRFYNNNKWIATLVRLSEIHVKCVADNVIWHSVNDDQTWLACCCSLLWRPVELYATHVVYAHCQSVWHCRLNWWHMPLKCMLTAYACFESAGESHCVHVLSDDNDECKCDTNSSKTNDDYHSNGKQFQHTRKWSVVKYDKKKLTRIVALKSWNFYDWHIGTLTMKYAALHFHWRFQIDSTAEKKSTLSTEHKIERLRAKTFRCEQCN